jgi:type II secretory pathway pseudopilin PulG
MNRPARAQGGFTYLLLLWWVALSGVMLMALGESWAVQAQRDREAELAYRGDQIRQAIEAYASVPVNEGVSRLPHKLEELLEDRRTGELRRHLRQAWRDPITRGGAWGLVRDASQGITGVHSLSRGKPLRAPPGVERYDEWRFVIGQAPAPSARP